MEKCKSISEFLALTKLDFNQECYLKKRFFGKEFENFDCPTSTKNYLWCVTMSHTFHDNFRFVGLDLHYIPCSLMHSEGRSSINETIPPCKLVKIRQIMMAFIHSEINIKHLPINDIEVHEQFGNRVFFHDRLIERWMCDIDIDVVSELFSTKGPSLSYIKECKYFVKKNIFLIFYNVRWRHGMGEDKLLIYVYDGDYFHGIFRRELTRLSDHEKLF